MNRFSQMRQNVMDGLLALPAWTGVEVAAIAIPVDVFYLQSARVVGVCQVQAVWDPKEADIANHGVKTAELDFLIAIKTAEGWDPTSGLSGPGETEDIADVILGTAADGANAGIRAIDVAAGIPFMSPLFLNAREKYTAASPIRAAGTAGPIATVLKFRTTTESL